MKSKQNFKGLDHYKLKQDENGNIKLDSYDDVLNARIARLNLLLDNVQPNDDINLTRLNNALSEKFTGDQGLSSEFEKEDQEIAQEELKMFSILDKLDDLTDVKSEDLLEVSLLLSDLSFIERNIVLNPDQNSDLAGFKNLFIEKKASGEEYNHKECESFLDNIEKINTIIKLELESRIEGRENAEEISHDNLQDDIGQAMDTVDKNKVDDCIHSGVWLKKQ
ncbi:WD_0853 family protein [Wolbachia endosymbiont of Ctenocephalides felis wCfeT]|uniref:WD_0853 family protein n=1 Tax=Wolbachia endosymbiont of Ctenocephalides felis wCfeT TaxID=2732593 RepID=UPI001445951D|nr:hypothetical protein [Wolbachia endosymbiont of Ctenocephalides felis wCfeT]